MANAIDIATSDVGSAILRYTNVKQGSVMQAAIHHIDFFKPTFDANQPPRIPPIVRKRIPIVP